MTNAKATLLPHCVILLLCLGDEKEVPQLSPVHSCAIITLCEINEGLTVIKLVNLQSGIL